ncbi:MAG: N-formylglutamate amidohydrolase [Myxococcales bacterium]|nr:N-formylglutamate amidohydrolase [Myxococcales bacterium]
MLTPGTRTADAAVEHIRGDNAQVLLTCEHASEHLPKPYHWDEADQWLLGTHWSHDIGAAEITRELARRVGCSAVLSRFTRLLVDPNRPINHHELFRKRAEGRAIALNATLSTVETGRRIQGYYREYHEAVERELDNARKAAIFSIHTFTPDYEGQRREVEVGVLFDRHEDAAIRMRDFFTQIGYRTMLNEPWSGRQGYAYSAEYHGRRLERVCLQIEVRQDISADERHQIYISAKLAPMLVRLLTGS